VYYLWKNGKNVYYLKNFFLIDDQPLTIESSRANWSWVCWFSCCVREKSDKIVGVNTKIIRLSVCGCWKKTEQESWSS
jgi:hypothetical protein